MPSWSKSLAALRSASWDELSAWAKRLSPWVSTATARRLRLLVDLAQRPRAPLVHVTSDDDDRAFDHLGNDAHFRQVLARRIGCTSESIDAHWLRFGLSPTALRAANTAPLIAVEIERAEAAPFARDGWLIMPRWVKLAIDLQRPDRELWSAKKREVVARIDRSPLEAEVVLGASAYAEFYQRFYEPTARARHDAWAYVRRPRYLARIAGSASILFVRDGSKRVAAMMLAPGGGQTLDALIVGVRDGAYQDTALAREAAYLFSIRHARAKGYSRLGLTSANPFLDDGLLLFKKRWGAEASVSPTDGRAVALRLRKAPPALAAALARSPFVHLVDPEGEATLTATTLGVGVRSLRGVRDPDWLAGEGDTLVDAFIRRARGCVGVA